MLGQVTCVNAHMTARNTSSCVGDPLTDALGADEIGAEATLDTADALFKGFADPTRIRILNVLSAGELCVCDIVEILEIAQPTASRHLAYLRKSGLVTATREWKFAHYRLSTPRDALHRTLVGCVATCFRGIPALDAERTAAERRVAERERAPCE